MKDAVFGLRKINDKTLFLKSKELLCCSSATMEELHSCKCDSVLKYSWKAISADIHRDRLSTDYSPCRPSVDRQSTACRSSVDHYVDRYSGRHSDTVNMIQVQTRLWLCWEWMALSNGEIAHQRINAIESNKMCFEAKNLLAFMVPASPKYWDTILNAWPFLSHFCKTDIIAILTKAVGT